MHFLTFSASADRQRLIIPLFPSLFPTSTRSTKSSPAAVRTAVAEILASSAALAPGPSALRP